MIGVIDYRAGNSPSVVNALENIGVQCMYVRCAEDTELCSGIILPGVGSADATMSSLRELDLVDRLRDRVINEKLPFLGICVGLQVLFEHSDEGSVDCLGFLKGEVKRFDADKVRIPQIGWNKVDFTRDCPLLNGIETGYFYFVNSYYALPTDAGDILGQADYGGNFCAFVNKGNIFASQCHLEKSGSVGLKLLENFSAYAISCGR